MKSNKKTTNKTSKSVKKVTSKSLPKNIYMEGNSYRVQKMINGTRISSNFSNLKNAKSYLKLITMS